LIDPAHNVKVWYDIVKKANIMTNAENRVKVGVPGFDELCHGGFIRDRIYHVFGTSGAGKTIFALQYIYNGATKFDENGIFIVTDEHPEYNTSECPPIRLGSEKTGR